MLSKVYLSTYLKFCVEKVCLQSTVGHILRIRKHVVYLTNGFNYSYPSSSALSDIPTGLVISFNPGSNANLEIISTVLDNENSDV